MLTLEGEVPPLPLTSTLGGRCARHPHLTDEDFKQGSDVT